MSRHGYDNPEFCKAADEYYDVDSAIKFLDKPVPEGCHRWRCLLCGWALDVTDKGLEIVGATCCGGCGMTMLRPIEEWNPA